MQLVYSLHHYFHLRQWKTLWGASFSDMTTGTVNNAGKMSEKYWSCLWCVVVVSCVEVLTPQHEFIFAKHHHANCIREEAV